MTVGAATLTAGQALANVGSEPGNVSLKPASGALTLTPTWSTTDGCPSGYQGSAQMSIFDASGTLLSRVSNVTYNVTSSFSGTLDANMSEILKFAGVHKAGSLEFAVGCYKAEAGGGQVKWMQSTLVTLSSDGHSFTSASPSGQTWSTTGRVGGAPAANNAGGAAVNTASASGTQGGGGLSGAALGGLIAAACALAAGTGGFVWYRRRNRSRLM